MTVTKFAPKSLKLTYFDFRARAEVARLAFHIGNIAFEDERISRDGWAAMKSKTPFGQLPVLTIDDTTQIAQSNGLMRFAGTMAGLYPAEDVLKAALVDQIVFHVEDMFAAVYMTFSIQNAEEKLAARKKLADERLPVMFTALDKVITTFGGDKWAVGDSVTIADLQVYCFVVASMSGNWDNIPKNIAEAYPKTMRVYNAVAQHSKVMQWEAAHRK